MGFLERGSKLRFKVLDKRTDFKHSVLQNVVDNAVFDD